MPKDYVKTNDVMVNHPSHYQSKNGIETIDAIAAAVEDLQGIEAYETGNIIKYLFRWKKKNGLQDLLKSAWYLQDLIQRVGTAENEEK